MLDTIHVMPLNNNRSSINNLVAGLVLLVVFLHTVVLLLIDILSVQDSDLD